MIDLWSVLLGLYFGGACATAVAVTTGVPVGGGLHAHLNITDKKTGNAPSTLVMLAIILTWPVLLFWRKR